MAALDQTHGENVCRSQTASSTATFMADKREWLNKTSQACVKKEDLKWRRGETTKKTRQSEVQSPLNPKILCKVNETQHLALPPWVWITRTYVPRP
eukprot:1158040-Pelagomonas_calceolata.AAC.10